MTKQGQGSLSAEMERFFYEYMLSDLHIYRLDVNDKVGGKYLRKERISRISD